MPSTTTDLKFLSFIFAPFRSNAISPPFSLFFGLSQSPRDAYATYETLTQQRRCSHVDVTAKTIQSMGGHTSQTMQEGRQIGERVSNGKAGTFIGRLKKTKSLSDVSQKIQRSVSQTDDVSSEEDVADRPDTSSASEVDSVTDVMMESYI